MSPSSVNKRSRGPLRPCGSSRDASSDPTWSSPSRHLSVSSGESPLVIVEMFDFLDGEAAEHLPLTSENKSACITRCK